MNLARAASAKALANLTQPEERPAPEPSSLQVPDASCESQSVPVPAAATRPCRAAAASARMPACKAVDPAMLFVRLAGVVRDFIKLEAQIAGGIAPATRAAPTAARNAATTGNAAPRAAAALSAADPRREPLREALLFVAERHPDRARLRRETPARLEEHLAADPDQKIARGDIFFTLCEELGIEINLAKIPDKYLILLSEPPNPRATSPP